MSGICSRHQGHDPTCDLCNAMPRKWKCDFCNKPVPTLSEGVTYRSTPFILQGEITGGVRDGDRMEMGVDEDWLACKECSPVVERGNVQELAEHSLRAYGMEGDEALTKLLVTAYTTFLEYGPGVSKYAPEKE